MPLAIRMLPPVGGERTVVVDRPLDGGETSGPVGVQHPVAEPQHPLASAGHLGVAHVVLLEGALAFACPGRVVLAAVDLDVHVRPDPPVEAADSADARLRLPRDARVAAPQPGERLAVCLITALNEAAPGARVQRRPIEDGVHALIGPAEVV